MKPRISRTRTGTICYIQVVTNNGLIIGYGWMFIGGQGNPDKPVLLSLDNEPMESGWYNIKLVSDHILALTSDGVH